MTIKWFGKVTMRCICESLTVDILHRRTIGMTFQEHSEVGVLFDVIAEWRAGTNIDLFFFLHRIQWKIEKIFRMKKWKKYSEGIEIQ